MWRSAALFLLIVLTFVVVTGCSNKKVNTYPNQSMPKWEWAKEHLETQISTPPTVNNSSSSAWFPTTPAGSAMAWGAVALAIIGGFITRSRGKLDYSAIPLALGLGILVLVVLRPTGFEFHLIPTSPWFWAALIFWGIAKIVPTRFDEYAMFAGVGLLFLLSLALRGIDPGSSYRFLSPAWWLLLLIWEVVIAEKVILGNEELRQRPFLRNLLLAGGWYILGAISSFG